MKILHIRRALASTLVLSSVTLGFGAHAQSTPVIGCGLTDGSVFNTAYNGSRMTTGSDPHWQVAIMNSPTAPSPLTMAPPTAGYAPAAVVSSPPGVWYAGFANANWIADSASGAHSGYREAFYRFDFTLAPAVSPTEFAPSFNFYADNSIWEVYVNGVAQSAAGLPLPQNSADPYMYQGFLQANAASLTLPNNWKSGANSLIVHVKSWQTYAGFQATFAANTSACAVNRAPTATPTLSGPVVTGSTVTGAYTYADVDSDPQNTAAGGTSYRFVTSADNSTTTVGDDTVVATGDTLGGSPTYAIQPADVGRYLFFCVTPAATSGSSPGLEVCTAVAGPITLAPTAVPTLSQWMLALLAGALGALGWRARSHRRV